MIIQNLCFSFFCILFPFFTTKIFISKKNTRISWIYIVVFSLLCFLSLQNENPIFLIFFSLLPILFLCIEFRNHLEKLMSILYVMSLVRFIFELLIIISLQILKVEIHTLQPFCFFTLILTFLFCITFKDFLVRILSNQKENKKYFFLESLLKALSILIIFFMHYPNPFSIQVNLFYILFIITSLKLALSLLMDQKKVDNYMENYEKMMDYSKFNENLLSEYKSFIHENQNKLIIMKGMVEENNTEFHEYIDFIINKKIKNNYYWLMEIKNIPIASIKGLLNYKLLKMKELQIETELYISEEVASLNQNEWKMEDKNDLYTVLGIFLDNAIEAALESTEKIISIHFYKEEEGISIILANTFKNVCIDQLEKKGYSTKGENRGYGLYLVKEIIKHSKVIQKETSIKNNYFVQKIIIKNQK